MTIAPAMSRAVLLRVVAGAVVLVSGLWALWPLNMPDLGPTTITPTTPPTEFKGERVAGASTHREDRVALDVAAFRTPLWVAPPPPPPRAPEPPPMRLQLLAIVREDGAGGGGYRAVLYDPDTDRVVVLGQGESLAGRIVEEVSSAQVRIRDSAGVRALALRTDAPASTGSRGGGP